MGAELLSLLIEANELDARIEGGYAQGRRASLSNCAGLEAVSALRAEFGHRSHRTRTLEARGGAVEVAQLRTATGAIWESRCQASRADRTFRDNYLYLTQVGDSRAYLVRGGHATQLTKDQSLTQRLVDAGELTEEEAEQSERKNIILQALGPDPRVRVDLTHQEIRKGDAVVVCSDGLSGQVTAEEIARTVAENHDLVTACGALIDLANERGGPDNITAVIARLDGDGLNEPDARESVGHEVYPLSDSESTTEPVPVYRGDPPKRSDTNQMVIAAVSSAAILTAALLAAS